MENYEIANDFKPLETDDLVDVLQSVERTSTEIDKYLNKISSVVNASTDIILKRELQHLTNLLASYNRLADRLRKERALSSEKDSRLPLKKKNNKRIVPILSQFDSVLRPDFYKDILEEEKKHRNIKISKKRTYNALPPRNGSPTYILENRGEIEKERLCKIISSSSSWVSNRLDGTPSKFLNRTSKSSKQFRYNSSLKVEDIREKEKDRLAKIFSGYTVTIPKRNQKSKDNRNAEKELELVAENGDLIVESRMVRVGEYSPLNGHQRGKTTLGIGEHEEQEKQLLEERKREYINSVAAQRQNKEPGCMSPARRNETNQNHIRPRMNSASTQTDSEESATSFLDNQTDIDSPLQSVNSSPCRRAPLEFSPREKLLSDLYGSIPMTHYQSALSEREKQAAYARALRAQIEEKKRLEEERKRKEKEEEDLIEKRVTEQAERLHKEFLKEQNKKHDWIQQKQAQEEILRRRLEELELQSAEIKKLERQKKLQLNIDIDKNQQKISSRGGIMPKRSAAGIQPSAFNVGSTVPLTRTTFTKSPMLEVAPLLDSDQQNILSFKASEMRRDYDSNEVGSLTLEPGVNLLSPQYNPRDIEYRMTNSYSEGFVPSVGHISPRIVSQQPERSPLSKRYSPQDNQPSVMTQSDQQPYKRPSSPVVPALQTDMLLKKSPIVLDDKRMVLPNQTNELKEYSSNISTLKKDSVESRNILTQLGEFRRKLAMEHQRLEQRLMHNSS